MLAWCVVASLVLHVTALIMVPGFVGDREAPGVPVLDVVLVRAETPPAVLPELPQPPAVARDSSRPQESKPKAKPRESRPARIDESTERASEASPILSEREFSADSAPAASPSPFESHRGSAVKPEARPASREPAAITPPAFNAGYLRNPPPSYPLIARRNGEQGTVTLRVLVTREGAPANVSVERTSGSGHLDHAALETVKSWRFVPARRGAEPVETWVLVPIVFRLEGSS